MGRRNDGLMGLFIGITRSGKSTPIKAMLPKAKRLLIWDAKNEYGGAFDLIIVRSLPDLLNRLRDCKAGGRFAYVPTGYSKQEFDSFCRLAHTWNRQSPAVIVIEELAAVTNSGKAIGYWGVLVNQSLGLGATLLATVQRGQEVDKSVMNASTYVYVCQHNTDDDARYAAKKFGVQLQIIPRKPLEFMIWTPAKGSIVKGYVEFQRNGKPVTTDGKPVFFRSGPNKRRLSLGATVGTFKGLAYR
jgi:hypothetical protein